MPDCLQHRTPTPLIWHDELKEINDLAQVIEAPETFSMALCIGR